MSQSGFVLHPGNISGNSVIFSNCWSETILEKGALLLLLFVWELIARILIQETKGCIVTIKSDR